MCPVIENYQSYVDIYDPRYFLHLKEAIGMIRISGTISNKHYSINMTKYAFLGEL